MAFYVGQKVVCVDVTNSRPFTYLKLNVTYTIESIIPNGGQLLFREIPGQRRCGVPDNSIGYHWSRFRPVVSRPTDISIFTKMLGPKETEDA